MDSKEKKEVLQGNAGHRGRLRQRFLEKGLDSLQDYEKLEFLLTFAISRRDVKPIAKELISKFKNISGVLDAPKEKLTEIVGMGDNSAAIFMLIKALATHYLGEKMERYEISASNLDSVIDYSNAQIGFRDKEATMVVYLNIKNMIIDKEITYGTVDQVSVYAREIMESALRYRATGLILVHNHPSGDCKPSLTDEKLTERLCNLGEAMSIRLVDHIIVCKDKFYSFAGNGKL
ncbi:MAG: DNA repair protein RadC [Victivallaceae bacterium]|nr:DNA repair protein RadC [Victivallaceae bacterium]